MSKDTASGSRVNRDTISRFKRTRLELNALLAEYRTHDHDGSHYRVLESDTKENPVIYFADDALRDALVAMEKEHNAQIDEPYLKNYGFKKLCRLFNPDEKVSNYSINKEKKFKHVLDQDKVLNRLDKEYLFWKNDLKKRSMATYKAEAERTQADIDAFEAKLDKRIADAGIELERIKSDFDDLEVRVISKVRAHSFYSLFYRQTQMRRGRPSKKTNGKSIVHKQIKRHISTSAPNVLWYEKGVRSDCSVDEFILQAENPFGDVYVMEL